MTAAQAQTAPSALYGDDRIAPVAPYARKPTVEETHAWIEAMHADVRRANPNFGKAPMKMQPDSQAWIDACGLADEQNEREQDR